MARFVPFFVFSSSETILSVDDYDGGSREHIESVLLCKMKFSGYIIYRRITPSTSSV